MTRENAFEIGWNGALQRPLRRHHPLELRPQIRDRVDRGGIGRAEHPVEIGQEPPGPDLHVDALIVLVHRLRRIEAAVFQRLDGDRGARDKRAVKRGERDHAGELVRAEGHRARDIDRGDAGAAEIDRPQVGGVVWHLGGCEPQILQRVRQARPQRR